MITQQEAEKARKVLKEFTAQEDERVAEIRQRQEDALNHLIEELPGGANLAAWAASRWEEDKKKGYGGGMTPDSAIDYYLRQLQRAMFNVCDAYNVAPKDLGL